MLIEVRTEDVLAPALPLRMLLPKQRIRGNRVKLVEVVGEQRPHHNQLSFQGRLAIHASSPGSRRPRHSASVTHKTTTASDSHVRPGCGESHRGRMLSASEILVAHPRQGVPVSAEENTRLAQSAYEAFGRGDM